MLFPGGHLPLQIFEVRYLDMIRKALANDAGFGVVTLLRGSEVRTPESVESFASIGTLAEIRSATMPAPGLMQIRCGGTTRFRIQSRERLKHGLWVAQVVPVADDQNVEVPGELEDVADALHALLDRWHEQELSDEETPIRSPYHFNDCSWVANRWAEMLPLPAEEKLRLLALDNPLLRLELIQDCLHAAGMLGTPKRH